MLTIDDTGSPVGVQVEAVQPLVRDNAVLAEGQGFPWLASSFESSAVPRIGLAGVADPTGWVTSSSNSIAINQRQTPGTVVLSNDHWVRVVRTEMRQFQNHTNHEVGRLSRAVEELTKAVASLRDGPSWTTHEIPEAAPDPASLLASDQIVALNFAADSDVWAPELSAAATMNLADNDPALRVAAARALAAHGGSDGASALSARLEIEPNKFVRAAIRAALEIVSA